MFNLITIGDIVIDTHVQIHDASLECKIENKPCQLCLDYASKIPITDSFQSLGGNAANVAVGAAKLGLETAILSSIGSDLNGDMAIEELNRFKVNTDLIYKEEKNPTRYSIVLNFQTERTILSYHKKRKYTWPKNLPQTDWIYYTGLSDGFKKIKSNLLTWLKKHPKTSLAFNPGSFQLKHHLDEVKKTASHADVLIINLQEAEKILNTTLKESKKINPIMNGLLNLGAKEAVITDAEKGAYVGSGKEIWHMEACPVHVVAKTGAGDAFSAGFVTARCLGYNRPQALRWGIVNSCAVITKIGAQNGLLTKNQMKAMLLRHSAIKPKPLS